MALRVWLHRTSNDIPAPWALELFHRCRQFNVLPAAGGAYEQDEWLMAKMDEAAGVSALYDIDGKKLLTGPEPRKELHAQLTADAQELIDTINARDNDE